MTGSTSEAGLSDAAVDREPVGPFVHLNGVSKTYQTRRRSTHALDEVNLTIDRGEFVILIGKSGCGKTTLLRILGGLIKPTTGSVSIGGRELWKSDRRDDEAVSKLGLVFQDANLFPWYTVQDNIALPLRLKGTDKQERLARAHELCEMVGLKGFERAYPRELSGGMRQRVAIARALSYNPEILLMDEPFGALDAMTRDRMNIELQSIAAETGATVVFVTHSISEAVFLADRVVVLTPGPGRMKSVNPVDFARPRSQELETNTEFQKTVARLRDELEEE